MFNHKKAAFLAAVFCSYCLCVLVWSTACRADDASAEALFTTAQDYYQQQDYANALRYYQQAAEQGHEEALARLLGFSDAPTEISPLLLNFIYAIFGGALTLFFMWLGCRLFNHSVSFDINEQLSRGNIAVGLMIMGIFIGIGSALGLVIGLGLN